MKYSYSGLVSPIAASPSHSDIILSSGEDGTLGGRQLYDAWGSVRFLEGDIATDYTYTGQFSEAYINLIRMGDRWLDPDLGRFTQPDSIVPDHGNPLGLDRYAYVAFNPVKFVDTSGHCWGFASGITGIPSYATTCNNLNMALTILKSSETSLGDKAKASAYIAAEGVAHVGLVVGVAGVACGLVGACAAAVEGALGIGTSACADGDCTNEATAAAQGVQRAADSIWNLSNFERGAAAEQAAGGRTPGMPFNFPVIDRFTNGIVTSIKSMNLTANTYQNIGRMSSVIRGYVNSVANFQGANWGGFNITNADIVGREVLLIIPPGATEAQLNALAELEQWALTQGVTLILQVVE